MRTPDPETVKENRIQAASWVFIGLLIFSAMLVWAISEPVRPHDEQPIDGAR